MVTLKNEDRRLVAEMWEGVLLSIRHDREAKRIQVFVCLNMSMRKSKTENRR